MYLKSIEVQGFKSFANKINFEFHNGITGIVGPNGSGKSNVADAVRWVLGEQRIKQLRGAKMEDVIFAGTQNRKPLGFAYVAITLDNSDHSLPIQFDEVTVSRRLFRSGESEYMINGSIARLKDINELFYDTGIGKEGYSIIGQGQIDKILSGKPEERRELFDEAAGIVKFKRRKITTQKKLEDEHANLVRVSDILSELEKQVRPLEKQSEVAKQYLKLKESLKNNDIQMFLLTVEDLKKKINILENNLTISENDLETTRAQYEATKLEYEQVEEAMETLSKETDDKVANLSQTRLQMESLKGQLSLFEQQISSTKQNEEQLLVRIEETQQAISKAEEEKAKYEKEKQNLSDTLKNADAIRKQEFDHLAEIAERIQEIIDEIDDAKNEIIELLNQKTVVKSKIQRYDTMLEQINIRKAELTQHLIRYSNDSQSQNQAIQSLESELQKVSDQISELYSKREQLENELKQKQKESQNLEQQSHNLMVEYQRNHSKAESLKNITERYEGYGNSIRKVMELKDSKPGIVGVVADIIKTEKKYEVAIETALGGNIQNIVTDNETCAKELIEYLKRGKFGRATFLPLSSLANRTGFNNEAALTEPGVLGLASDLVQIEKAYEAVSKFLLGRIVVVDHIDHALALARKFRYTLRIVTLEGELLNAGGSMSGGAYKNNSNLLGRRREIEDLENNLKIIQQQQSSIENQMKENKTKRLEITEELESIKNVIHEQSLLQNSIKMNLNQASQKKKELEDSFEGFEKEKIEISNQITDIKENNSELHSELQTYEDLNRALEERISQLNQKLEEEKILENAQSEKVDKMKIEFSQMDQKISFIQENIDRITNSIEELTHTKNQLIENKNHLLSDSEVKQQETESIRETIAMLEQSAEDFTQEIEAYRVKKEAFSKNHREFFEKRESLSDKMNQLDKDIYRMTSQRDKLEEQRTSQNDYMWSEYELTYGSAKEFRDESYDDLALIKKDIAELKNQIRSLGVVNVNAIEEYKVVAERYEFLRSQHEDLLKAEEELVRIIDELDRGMREQFTEKFEEIRTEFDKVFKELFGGGKGTIELNEEEDILEASISIISQPPGKKLQNMMQLSGGEKALTAIALLFAIQNLKPSPFCLLDEIEAALDDSNVSRYANYLHKLTKYTQFIVITHRRGTMEAADRLYGITMQEKGISTLVSVDLLDAQLTN